MRIYKFILIFKKKLKIIFKNMYPYFFLSVNAFKFYIKVIIIFFKSK